MGVNKVIYGNETLIDLTGTTVTADKLLKGYTAYDASGELIVGTYDPTPKVNLFDPSTATYNARIRGVGVVGSDSPGRLATGVIPISDISTLTVHDITEVRATDNTYAQIALYSSSNGDSTDKLYVYNYPNPTYSFDIASLKSTYPTATHARLDFTLSTSSITTNDTADLKIYGE